MIVNVASMQKEILQGNFKLKISEKMAPKARIEKFALEPVAYFLHKRRDFLSRLNNKKELYEKKDIIEY